MQPFMELSKPVVSLELAMRLKELRVKQENLFSWYWHKEKYELVYNGKGLYRHDEISAFTVAELGDVTSGFRWTNT